MKSKNTFGTTFFIRKPREKNKDAKWPIYAKITVDTKSTELSLKCKIEYEKWNIANGIAKGKSEEIQNLNSFLKQVYSGIADCYRQLQLDRKLITADAVKKMYLGEEEKEHSLLSTFEYHNTEMKRELEPGTQKNYHTTKRYVEAFLKTKHMSDIYLSQLNYKFITDFEKYVKENPMNANQPCTQNGTMKHIERLRKVVNLAVKNEWLEKDPFQKYASHFVKKERDYLTLEELKAIEKKQFTIERIKLVKDLFIFSCYTGLAYIDAMKLVPDDVRRGIDGQYWLFSIRKKNRNNTEKQVKIPLLPEALNIIEKYKNHPQVIFSGSLLPRMSNQKLNSYLKEVADLCEIKKELTFHMARHTFATTVTLTNGVPIETVSDLLGHSSIKTTQIYAKITEQKVSNDMLDLRRKLRNKQNQNKRQIGKNFG